MARLLIIDDSPTQRACLGYLLEEAGHEPAAAADLTSALELARRLGPELALIELHLYRDNGFEVARRLERQAEVPAVLLSGRRRETDGLWARTLGIRGLLHRPLDGEALDAAVRHLLAGGSLY